MSGRRITPHEDEFRQFIDVLVSESITKYVEIGARDGNTFFKVMSALPVGSLGVAVDLPGACWGWKRSETSLRAVGAELEKMGRKIVIIMGNSADPAVVDAVRSHGPYDAAFIDADHSYDAVKSDWLNYRSMARIVAFHDIAPINKPRAEPIDVPRLWHEVSTDPEIERSVDIVGHKAGMGIGVAWRHEKGVTP